MNNCDAISAVRYLPDILELMRIFSDKFHSRFKRDKASKLQIGDFITKYKEEASNIEALVDSFIAAWNIMAANQRKHEHSKIKIYPIGLHLGFLPVDMLPSYQ